MRKLIAFGFVGLIILIWAPSARAGGGQWGFKGWDVDAEPAFAAGEEVHAYTGLWLEGVASREERGAYWGGPEHGPFYGYIAPRGGEGWGPYPPPIPDDAVYVGEVVFSKSGDARVLDVDLRFVMPDLEPGFYSLLHCNDPCTRQIGDTMSTPITVVEDPGQAFISGQVDQLDRQMTTVRQRLRGRVQGLRARMTGIESDIDGLKDDMMALQARSASAQVPGPETSGPALLPWLALLAIPAALGARVWDYARRRGLRSAPLQLGRPLPGNLSPRQPDVYGR